MNDHKLFEKLEGEIWYFRTNFLSFQYRIFAFWDNPDNNNTLVLATHGVVKKSNKIPKSEIERAEYEMELKVDILGEMIKSVRKERHLTQEQLGKLVGVNKSQISKLERNIKNVTIETILKVFRALKTNIKFLLERMDENYSIV